MLRNDSMRIPARSRICAQTASPWRLRTRSSTAWLTRPYTRAPFQARIVLDRDRERQPPSIGAGRAGRDPRVDVTHELVVAHRRQRPARPRRVGPEDERVRGEMLAK